MGYLNRGFNTKCERCAILFAKVWTNMVHFFIYIYYVMHKYVL